VPIILRNEQQMEDTTLLYRLTRTDGAGACTFRRLPRWPPRLPEQPIFYPVTNWSRTWWRA
jgi:hypothetical protein